MTFVIRNKEGRYVAENRNVVERYTWAREKAEKFKTASEARQVQGNEEHVLLLAEGTE